MSRLTCTLHSKQVFDFFQFRLWAQRLFGLLAVARDIEALDRDDLGGRRKFYRLLYWIYRVQFVINAVSGLANAASHGDGDSVGERR